MISQHKICCRADFNITFQLNIINRKTRFIDLMVFNYVGKYNLYTCVKSVDFPVPSTYC